MQRMDEEKQDLLKEKMVPNSSQNKEGESKKL